MRARVLASTASRHRASESADPLGFDAVRRRSHPQLRRSPIVGVFPAGAAGALVLTQPVPAVLGHTEPAAAWYRRHIHATLLLAALLDG